MGDEISTTISPTPSPTPTSPTATLSETEMLMNLLDDVQSSQENKTQEDYAFVVESIKLTHDLFGTNITALPFQLQAVMKEGKDIFYLPYSLASHALKLAFPTLENLETFFEQAKTLVGKKIQSKTYKLSHNDSITIVAKFI